MRKKKKETHTAQAICRQLLGQQLPVQAAELGALEAVAQGLEQTQGSQPDLYQLMLLVQLEKAMQGDTRAATFVRDCAGDKPAGGEAVQAALSAGDRALLAKLARRVEQADAKKES